MTDHLTRAFMADLEVRADGRTLVGLCAPFGQATPVADMLGRYDETIERGAFARTIAERGPERVKLLVQHDQKSLPIGRAQSLREDTAGLVGEFRVSKTQAGDEVLELVRDGSLDGLSIGFRTVRDSWSPDKRSRRLLEARLDEVSVCSFPAYEAARITAVRGATPHLSAALDRLHLLERIRS